MAAFLEQATLDIYVQNKITEPMIEHFMDGMIVEEDSEALESLRECCRYLIQTNGMVNREDLAIVWVCITQAQLCRLADKDADYAAALHTPVSGMGHFYLTDFGCLVKASDKKRVRGEIKAGIQILKSVRDLFLEEEKDDAGILDDALEVLAYDLANL